MVAFVHFALLNMNEIQKHLNQNVISNGYRVATS